MARLSVDISGLRALSRGAEETKRLKKQMYEEILKELAARLLRKVILRTPVGVKPTNVSPEVLNEHWKGYVGGTLRRGWTAKTEAEAESGGAPDINVFLASTSIEDTGHGYCITIKNPCHYASYVEYGHRQTPGRFVPQLGKRLKASWVPGQFMLKISEDELRTQAPAIIQRKVERFLLRHMLGGGR